MRCLGGGKIVGLVQTDGMRSRLMSWMKGEVKADRVAETEPEGVLMRDAARGGSKVFKSGELGQLLSG